MILLIVLSRKKNPNGILKGKSCIFLEEKKKNHAGLKLYKFKFTNR